MGGSVRLWMFGWYRPAVLLGFCKGAPMEVHLLYNRIKNIEIELELDVHWYKNV